MKNSNSSELTFYPPENEPSNPFHKHTDAIQPYKRRLEQASSAIRLPPRSGLAASAKKLRI